MYYEEKMINGVMHYRTDPDDEFEPYTLEGLSARYALLKDKNKQLREKSEIGSRFLSLLESCDVKINA